MKILRSTILVLFILLYSCAQEEFTTEVNNIEKLKKDVKFIELVNSKILTVKKIKDIEKVNSFIDKEDLNKKELNQLAIALCFSDTNDYSSYIKMEYEIQNYLEIKLTWKK
ncbi:MAG: hypothetical protein V3U80_02060 [Flavobacteriaceae bacterium]